MLCLIKWFKIELYCLKLKLNLKEILMGKKLLLGLIGAGAIDAATVFHKKENLS